MSTAEIRITWPDGTMMTYHEVDLTEHVTTAQHVQEGEERLVGEGITVRELDKVTAYSLVIRGAVQPRETDGQFFLYESRQAPVPACEDDNARGAEESAD